jgi:hypothetical protein
MLQLGNAQNEIGAWIQPPQLVTSGTREEIGIEGGLQKRLLVLTVI